MKKILNLVVLISFMCAFSFTSCSGEIQDSGSQSISDLNGKAFIFKDVETNDNEPEDSVTPDTNNPDDNNNENYDDNNNENYDDNEPEDSVTNPDDNNNGNYEDNNNENSDGNNNEQENIPSAKDYEDDETVSWVYFISLYDKEGKASFGKKTYTVKYNGETDDEISRKEKEDSTKVEYYGNYKVKTNNYGYEVPDFYEINYKKVNNKWENVKEEDNYYKPSTGLFKDSDDKEINKKYEYSYKNKQLIIKLSEKKSNKNGITYDQWTTWTYDEIEVTEDMKDSPDNTNNNPAGNDNQNNNPTDGDNQNNNNNQEDGFNYNGDPLNPGDFSEGLPDDYIPDDYIPDDYIPKY